MDQISRLRIQNRRPRQPDTQSPTAPDNPTDSAVEQVSRAESTRSTGSIGQVLDLTANYFSIKSRTGWALYKYRVDFSPQEDRIEIKRFLLKTHRTSLGGYLFDGTTLFSCIQFAQDPFILSSRRRSDDEIVTITLSYTGIVEPNNDANNQVFNLILRNCLRYLNLTLVDQNYYDPHAKVEIKNHRLQLWPGYKTTIGMFDSGLLLRAEISSKVMRDETVLDFYRECMQNRDMNFMDHFKDGVIGSVVLTRFNNKTYRIDDINENVFPISTFKKKDGSSLSYIEYYKNKWGITIHDDKQPMLVSKKRMPLGSRIEGEEQFIYLVPELCSLTGIMDSMRENVNLMRDLAEHTRVAPGERIIRYNNFMNRLQSTPESMKSLTEWNLTVNENLLTLNGRKLPVQNIYSKTTKYYAGHEADWTSQLRALPMYATSFLPKWVIIYPNQNEQEVKTFVDTLRKVAHGMSFNILMPEFCPINAGNMRCYSDALERAICQFNPLLILCVTLSVRPDVYNLIKRHLCVDRAVPSQVVTLKNVQKNSESVCTKIAVQINCKIGGAPWRIAIPTPGIMIVGFDVCQDKQNKNKIFGALIASLNDSHTQYFSDVTSSPIAEIPRNFGISIGRAVQKYRKINEKLPSQIIIYRKGYEDEQIFYESEIRITKMVCKMFYGDEVPPMAFILVKNRISTRFFSSGNRGFSNPPPGTVVDSVITDPTKYDFYLISQHVRFGTVTPTYYNVLIDTLLDWGPNKMQLLTYKLTHMYYNWSGNISVPAPCQMAYKLAFFTSQSLGRTPNYGLNELLYFL